MGSEKKFKQGTAFSGTSPPHPLRRDLAQYRKTDYWITLQRIVMRHLGCDFVSKKMNRLLFFSRSRRCGSLAMRCCVCQLPVRGLASACEKCLHGGHWSHLRAWFRDGMGAEEVTCPAGCGCKCWANDEAGEAAHTRCGIDHLEHFCSACSVALPPLQTTESGVGV